MLHKSFNNNSLSISEKIGQLFFIGIHGDRYNDSIDEILEKVNPGGVCLFARNIKKAERTRDLLDKIRKRLPLEPFLSIDQEGGLVDRLSCVVESMPSAKDLGKGGERGPVIKQAELTAGILRVLGFNMNFAPVMDVTDKSRKGFIMDTQRRTFGNSPSGVIELTKNYLCALQNQGVLGCAKHFPGIGAVESDPHDELPSIDLTREELFKIDIAPYASHFKNKNVFAVMTGHTTYSSFDLQEVDSDGSLLPSSLSCKIVNGLLRSELGFKHVALTDDLEMGAVVNNYGIADASKMAIQAGNDFLLICNDPKSVYEGFEALLKAVEKGQISEERIDKSLKRISFVRDKLKPPLEFSKKRLKELSDEIVELKKSI